MTYPSNSETSKSVNALSVLYLISTRSNGFALKKLIVVGVNALSVLYLISTDV